MIEIFLKLLAVVALVAANGFFVAAEFAIVKVRGTQIDTLIQQGRRRAIITKSIVTHLDAYLSATQFGITLTSLGLGWIGEPAVSRLLEPLFQLLGVTDATLKHTLAITVGFSIITLLHIVFGELAPKSLAIWKPQQVAMFVSWPLKLFFVVFRPAIWVLNGSSNLLLRGIGIQPASEAEVAHSEEELRLLISEGIRSGVIDEIEHKIIQGLFEFNDKHVREIMVPRQEVAALDAEADPDAIFRTMAEQEYSRYPVYEGTLENILGVVATKDLLQQAHRGSKPNLRALLRPAYFVPETKPIGELLLDLQQRKVHMAIVANEYGEVEGVVTLEDILEEIVGEIHDEHDSEPGEIRMDASGRVMIDPGMTVRDFNERFNADLPLDPHYSTVAGFLLKQLGRLPEAGDRILVGRLNFTVHRMVAHRIAEVCLEGVSDSSA